MARKSKPSKWPRIWAVICTLGAVAAFGFSNYWSYQQGRQSGDSLLIETLDRYSNFFAEVRSNADAACDAEHQLQGLYRMRYESMLPVIGEEIAAPYDNPCPLPLAPPGPVRNLRICKSWESIDEFTSDPALTIPLQVADHVLLVSVNANAKDAFIDWYRAIQTGNPAPPPIFVTTY